VPGRMGLDAQTKGVDTDDHTAGKRHNVGLRP
jgi:hypothetical protein